MDQTAECIEEYCRDGNPEAFARLVAEHRPMVTAICRRYVVESGDAEDAVQETFVKLARQAAAITGNVGAWLTAVAGTTALDYARRSLRERTRLQRLAAGQQEGSKGTLSWKGIEMRLMEALEGLEPEMRSLVMARFFAGEAVQQIARRSGVSSSTMSRRVTAAVSRVKRALSAMGYGSLEEMLLGAEEMDFAEPPTGRKPSRGGRTEAVVPPLAGKIRVGVLASYQTSRLVLDGISGASWGFQPNAKYQLAPTRAFHGPKYQFIALLEPGTEEYSTIEQGLREHQITQGMLDATDAEALKLLDVIVLGHNYAVTTRLLDAVTQAVESGVGLYHEGHAGTEFPGTQDPRVCRLMLTNRFSMYHTPQRHNLPRPATVVAGHSIIGGVAVGTPVMIDGCGPVCVPHEGVKVLVTKDEAVTPIDPPTPELNGLRMPALMVGQLGRGRVAVVTMRPTTPMQRLPGLRGNFVHNVFDWLAEERIAERRIWSSSDIAT